MTTTTSSDKLTLIITCEFILCVGISKERLFHPSPHSKELCYRHFENSKKNLANYLIRRSSQYSLASVKKSFSDNDHQVYGLECLQKSIVIVVLQQEIRKLFCPNLFETDTEKIYLPKKNNETCGWGLIKLFQSITPIIF